MIEVPETKVIKRKKIFDKKSIVFSVMVLVMFVILLVASLKGSSKTSKNHNFNWTPEMERDLAGKLRSSGLNIQAAQHYEAYLNSADPSPKERSNLAYSIGNIYMEAKDYEQALNWFYQVEIINPDTGLKSEVSSKIITCLENLGRYHAAEYALNARTALDSKDKDEDQGGKVIAKIGNDEIRLAEIDRQIEELPAWIKNEYKDKQKKKEFVEQYVVSELLYRKGIKKGYDKDKEIRKQVDQIVKQLIAKKVTEEEIKSRVSIEEDDIKNYFEANKDSYKQQEGRKISLIVLSDKTEAEKVLKRLKKGELFSKIAREKSEDHDSKENDGKYGSWIYQDQDFLGLTDYQRINDTIFELKKGETTDIIESDKKYYVFKIDDIMPEKMKTYEQVKDRVRNDYTQRKQQLALKKLMQEILESSDVKFFSENIE